MDGYQLEQALCRPGWLPGAATAANTNVDSGDAIYTAFEPAPQVWSRRRRRRKSAQIIEFPRPIVWGKQQAAAIERFLAWHRDPDAGQIFRLLGVAGAGKTSLAKTLAENASAPIFVAFTGKAAAVLRRKGCPDARTIHQLLYSCGGSYDRDIEDEPIVIGNHSLFPEPESEHQHPPAKFILKPKDCLASADLIVVDEASMVGDGVCRDLLSLGTRILALGDPTQLPPVGDGCCAMLVGEPDVFLTEIHRQAQDCPIIKLSMMARAGEPIPSGRYGDSLVASASLGEICELAADQILCGTNATRKAINRRIREQRGIGGWLPEPGERLVCLRNMHGLGLSNGTVWVCREIVTGHGLHSGQPVVRLILDAEDNDISVPFKCPIDRFHDYFDFGYCITVHKAQGSEWNNVVLVDESSAFRENANRWLYTGITRAAKHISLVKLR